jgi:hypothetical protein
LRESDVSSAVEYTVKTFEPGDDPTGVGTAVEATPLVMETSFTAVPASLSVVPAGYAAVAVNVTEDTDEARSTVYTVVAGSNAAMAAGVPETTSDTSDGSVDSTVSCTRSDMVGSGDPLDTATV